MQNKGLAFVIIGSMLLFGVLFWIADSVLWFYLYKYNLQFMVFEMPESIFDTLFYNISKHALFVRITFLIACFLTGFLIYTYIKTRNDALRKATHVNNLLRSLITIRKLIAQEHDRDMLLEKVCETLTTHGGFLSAWILPRDSDRIIHTPDKQGTDIHLKDFIAQVQSGELPPCASGVTATETTVIYHHDRCTREGCPVALLERIKQPVFLRRIIYEDCSFGILYAVAPFGVLDLKEELTIFDEIADDLASALYAISREEVIVSVAKDRDHREAIVETISYIAGKFLPETDFKENILDIFSRLGGLLGYNSILLFKNEIDENGTLAGFLQERWNRETKISENAGFDTNIIGYDPFISWEMDLCMGKDIIVLCSEMDGNQKDRFTLLQSGSCILVPVFVGNDWWGFLACTDPDENKSWSHVDRLACNVTGALIGAALTREKMSQSVKRTQERYYDLFNRISQSIMVFDISGKKDFSPISEVNETCCETFRYTRNELHSRTLSDLMTIPGDELLHYHADQLHDTPTLTFEADFVRHDSSVFSGEITLHLMHDEVKTRILAVIRDITERKKAEMDIIASELRYRQLFESAGTPILVLHNSEIFDCNYQASLLFGKYPYEMYESSFLDYAPEYQPDGMRSMEKILQILLSVKRGNTEVFSWEITGRDNKEIITEITMTRLSAEDDETILTLIRDISSIVSEQKQMNFLSSITEQVSDFLITIDSDTSLITYANKAAEDEFGYTLSEIQGKDISILFANLFLEEESIIEFITAIAEKKRYSCIIPGNNRDGSTFLADIRMSPLLDEHNDMRAVIIAGRNITGIVEMQERELISMRQIEENISQLAILNDQIRNPLTLIMGYAELENGMFGDRITEQVRIINSIIDQLDVGFLKSDSIREYLRKHHDISSK